MDDLEFEAFQNKLKEALACYGELKFSTEYSGYLTHDVDDCFNVAGDVDRWLTEDFWQWKFCHCFNFSDVEGRFFLADFVPMVKLVWKFSEVDAEAVETPFSFSNEWFWEELGMNNNLELRNMTDFSTEKVFIDSELTNYRIGHSDFNYKFYTILNNKEKIINLNSDQEKKLRIYVESKLPGLSSTDNRSELTYTSILITENHIEIYDDIYSDEEIYPLSYFRESGYK